MSESIGAPCNTAAIDPGAVWGQLLDLARTRDAVGPLVANLRLVSLTPQRAVVGHAPRDRFAATMALEQLKALFAQVLGNPVSVLLQELKDVPSPAAAPAPAAACPTALGMAPEAKLAAAQPEAPAAGAPAAGRIDARAAVEHPLVKRAAELLNGKVVRVTARTDKP